MPRHKKVPQVVPSEEALTILSDLEKEIRLTNPNRILIRAETRMRWAETIARVRGLLVPEEEVRKAG